MLVVSGLIGSHSNNVSTIKLMTESYSIKSPTIITRYARFLGVKKWAVRKTCRRCAPARDLGERQSTLLILQELSKRAKILVFDTVATRLPCFRATLLLDLWRSALRAAPGFFQSNTTRHDIRVSTVLEPLSFGTMHIFQSHMMDRSPPEYLYSSVRMSTN